MASNYLPRNRSKLGLPQNQISALDLREVTYEFPAAEPLPSTAKGRASSGRGPFTTSARDLNGLWNLTQGAGLRPGEQSEFVMNMYQHLDRQSCTFGPSPSNPFYSLTWSRPESGIDEITLHRSSTITRDSHKIVFMELAPHRFRESDGLVTLIYPRRAVVAAQRELARVSPHTCGTAAAVKAAEPELCTLVWSQRRKRYELEHPAMQSSHADREVALVVKIEGKVGFHCRGAKGRVKLVNVTNRETLVELDFGKRILRVNTAATSKVESRHIVDVAVSTLMAVAAVEGRDVREKVGAGQPEDGT